MMRVRPVKSASCPSRPVQCAARWVGLAAVVLTAGCEYLSPPHQEWTEARVVGRVVDGDSKNPVADAKITRVRPNNSNTGGFGDRDKGGPQMVDQPAVATSDASGKFRLEAVRTAYLLLDSFPDYAVTLRVQAPGYQTTQILVTNVTYAGGDKKSVPIIDTGDIPVRRK